jgi:hypothetical protein
MSGSANCCRFILIVCLSIIHFFVCLLLECMVRVGSVQYADELH